MYGWAKGSDRRWRRTRARKLAAEPRCERCLRQGRLAVATEVHHVVPLAKGGARYDDANLESVCSDCHDDAHRPQPKGTDLRGFPVDPNHPWASS